MTTTHQHLEKNHEAYLEQEERLIVEHLGKVALFHDGDLVEIYDDMDQAYDAGCEKFGLGHFSVEVVGQKPASLGILDFNIPAGVPSCRQSE